MTIDQEQVEQLAQAAELGLLKDMTGTTFVLTGKMSMKREDMVRFISACGGRVSPRIQYGVRYLIVGAEGATKGGGQTKKLLDARRFGVTTISEDQFVSMVMGAGLQS